MKGIWISDSGAEDVTAAFRGTFELNHRATVILRLFGAHVFEARLDGRTLAEGPYRFVPGHPEYEERTIALDAGRHVVAAQVRAEGIRTRLLAADAIPPCFLFEAWEEGTCIPVFWKSTRLKGCLPSDQRINRHLGCIEWTDTRLNPPGWQTPEYDDSAWDDPVDAPDIGVLTPLSAGPVRTISVKPNLMDKGTLAGPFDGTERPSWAGDADVSWCRRDLAPEGKATGVWRRYDLGHVRLGRPEFLLKCPAGAVVEFAYSESLQDGRVMPVIPMSGGVSRNLDHFVARGGRQMFRPMAVRGGRYLEAHVQAPPGQAYFVEECFLERSYYGDPAGRFLCDDDLLTSLWRQGVNTVRTCVEDAVINNPSRERAQWVADGRAAMGTAAFAFNDLRVFKRGMRQAAYAAGEDGLVAALSPGETVWRTSDAALWVNWVLEYSDVAGDLEFLREMYPYAVKTLAAFDRHVRDDGLEPFGEVFIDWGCPEEAEGRALGFYALEAFRALERWGSLLNEKAPYPGTAARLEQGLRAWLEPLAAAGRWEAVGYHLAVLALRSRVIPEANVAAGCEYVKRHILGQFPNKGGEPRLTEPGVRRAHSVTPYFGIFAFPSLVENGHMDFVLDQFRTWWRRSMTEGMATAPEVFEGGWSLCQAGSAWPAGLLSRYVLGLTARFGDGPKLYNLRLIPGGMNLAWGRVPLVNGTGEVGVSWKQTAPDRIVYRVTPQEPILVNVPDGGEGRVVGIKTGRTFDLRLTDGEWRAEE